MANLSSLTESIMKGDRTEAARLTQEVIDAGTAPEAILDALVMGMDDIGRRFKCDDIFVPEVLIAARAMKESMARLDPVLADAGIRPDCTAVIGTVDGDLHDIGKNLVAMLWKGANFNVVDLGTNVRADEFVFAVNEHDAQLVGLSSLLTTTLAAMKATVETIRAVNPNEVKILVGGAPVTQEFADWIGADGYAPDAATAVDVARALVPVCT